MKLRIAMFNYDRSGNREYIIQYRTWYGIWKWALFITDGSYNSLEAAQKDAEWYLKSKRDRKKLLHTWEVEI